jgi:YgiT-type zinc finger domain-containing protein
MTMARTHKNMRCPECGGNAVLETRLDTVEYKGRKSEVKVEGYWCEACPEAILESEALKKREAAFHALKAQVEGVLTPT